MRTCPVCGAANGPEFGFCTTCGGALDAATPVQGTPAPDAPAPPPPNPYAPPPAGYAAPPPPAGYAAPPPAYAPAPVPYGAPTAPYGAPPVPYGAPGYPMAYGTPLKSKTTAALLAFFLGIFGVHRFYLGHTGLGVVFICLLIGGILTFGLTWIVGSVWALVDFIMILTGSLRDSDNRPLV